MSDYIPHEIWLEQAKRLPVGGRIMDIACCKTGGNRDSLLITHKPEGYGAFCFRCKQRGWMPKGDRTINQIKKERDEQEFANQLSVELPRDFTLDIPSAGLVWLWSGGVFADTARNYGIGWSPSMQRVILPIYRSGELVYVQGRDVTGYSHAKYLSTASVPKEEILAWSLPIKTEASGCRVGWKRSTVSKSNTTSSKNEQCQSLNSILVLTEDFLSTIVVGDVCRSAALMGTSLSVAQMGAILSSGYKKICVWLDSDYAGRSATRTILRQLRLAGLQATSLCTEQDPKKVSRNEINERLQGLTW